MYKVVQPVDGKEVNIKDVRTEFHEVPDLPKGNSTKCLVYTVVGNYREWPNYSIYNEFIKSNPELDMGEILNGN